jgi:hypothetical protein
MYAAYRHELRGAEVLTQVIEHDQTAEAKRPRFEGENHGFMVELAAYQKETETREALIVDLKWRAGLENILAMAGLLADVVVCGSGGEDFEVDLVTNFSWETEERGSSSDAMGVQG